MNNMNYSIFRLTLNLHSHRSQASIPVKKFDTAVRFYITITDGGLPYTIEDGCMAVFRGKKADDSVLVNYCRIENGIVVYDFTEQTTSCTGIINCQIDLIGIGGRKIASPTFVIVVDDNVVYDKDIITSYDEKNVLESLVASADNAKYYAGVSEDNSEYAYDSALKAEGYALGTHGGYVVDSTSPYHENNAKYYAKSASANELASRQNMDTAISKAEDAKDSAEMAEEFAQDARNSATEAIDACNEAMGYAEALKVDRVTDIKLEYDTNTHKVEIALWGVKSDGSEDFIGTCASFDLPLESVVVDGRYDKEAEEVVLTLQNGNEIRFTVPTLVDGLVSQADFNARIQEYEKLEALHWEHILELGEIKTCVKVNGKFVSEFDADTKVTKFPDNVHNMPVAYHQFQGNVSAMVISNATDANSIARRYSDGTLRAATPQADADLTTKKYVDEAIKGATLEITESTQAAYEHQLPEEVESNAILDSIKGVSVPGDNGTLLQAPVTEVKSQNAQLFNGELITGYYEGASVAGHGSTIFRSFKVPLKAGTYTLSSDIPLNWMRYTYDDAQQSNPVGGEWTKGTFTVAKDCVVGISLRRSTNNDWTQGGISPNLMLNRGEKALPYQEFCIIETYTIPTEIQALEDYGKEYTTLDFDKKQFVNDGASIVLDGVTTKFNTITPISSLGLNACVFNFSSSKKPTHSYESLIVSQPFKASASQKVNNCYFLTQYNQFVLIPSENFETVEAANEWLAQNPVTVRYRTAADPVVTDLSKHLTDYDRFRTISVSGGGAITFENEHSLAVTSTITYLRRKS